MAAEIGENKVSRFWQLYLTWEILVDWKFDLNNDY